MLSIHPEYNCTYPFDLNPATYTILTFLFLFLFLYFLFKDTKKSFLSFFIAFTVSISGLYHVYLRVSSGCVLDYFKLAKVNFDIADIVIVAGLIYLLSYKYARQKNDLTD